MIKNLQIFETGMLWGNMNTAKAFYPKEYTVSQRQEEFLMRRLALGLHEGFDGRKMFMADQAGANWRDLKEEIKQKKGGKPEAELGSYYTLYPEYVKQHPTGWSDIPEDILIITDQIPGVVAGHPVADCPVVILSDVKNSVTAVCHCQGSFVDQFLPMFEVDALKKAEQELGKVFNEKNIQAYVGASAGNSWTYDSYPNWVKNNKVWTDSITEDKNGIFHIDLKKAVVNQLEYMKVPSISVSSIDTIIDPRFYSNCASSPKGLNQPEKAGRNFTGAFYADSDTIPQKVMRK